MLRLHRATVFGAFVFCAIGATFASAQAPGDSNLTLRLQGVDIEVNEDGSWTRIYATGTQAVSFPDRRGVNNAYIIAEERAKGAIARWFSQTVETGRVYSEAESTLETAIQTRGTDKDGFAKTAQRNLSSSLKETFGSSAKAVLQGVTVLEQTYDEKAEEVSVKVGLSRATIAAAREVQKSMKGEVPRQGTEVRGGRTMPGAAPPSAAIRSFTAARGFVRGLRLRSRAEWDAYLKSGEKPTDIPGSPDSAYKSQWVSWEDWLGN